MGGSNKARSPAKKSSSPRPSETRGEGSFALDEGLMSSSSRALARSSPVELDRPRPSRRGSLADMLHLSKKSHSSSKITDDDYSKPKNPHSSSRPSPKSPKSPKLFRLKSKSLLKRHQSIPESKLAPSPEAPRRYSAAPTLFDSEQGFIITPPETFGGKKRVAEMVSRMKGYHSVSVDLESLPQLVISTMVTLSVHTSFPVSLYLYMLGRNEGNSRATCEDLIGLGWGVQEREGESRAPISRTISSRKDEHFTTPYYHGDIPLEFLVKKIRLQQVGSFLTYAVVQDHTFQYYCLFVTKNVLYTSKRDYSDARSPSKRKISPRRRTRKKRASSPEISPRVSPEVSPRSQEIEKGLIVCVAISGPIASDDFLRKNECIFPLMRRQQPSVSFVPFLKEHASQTSSSSRSSLENDAEDPNYALELTGVLTAALPLEQRIFKYKSKLEALLEELESFEANDPQRKAFAKCCDDFREKIQQLKLSLYGQEETEAATSGSTCGFLSFSDMSLTVVPTNSIAAETSANPAIRESESLAVGFLWAVDDV